ncbi:hypothetical protein KPH14_003773 [Odynerus spinipes]|uniref:Uncharacterized protein n=1 Tax=Odynerus spinipes TaxID=1348599 RepID=A0AAD9RY06_9HYME|nr:hypothetical protein KPH14_003773 [Odynerus spinipes]
MENLTNDQENSSKSSEDIDEEKKRIKIAQLENDIAYQNSVLVELKKQLNSYNHAADLSHCSEPDTIIDIKEDLYIFAGIHCVQLEAGYVFQFSTGCKITANDIYCVEILKTGSRYKLGRWVMPMSIHLKDMVLQYPLHSLKNFKPFLNCCKHHIDCYASRREQYYQLKDFLVDTRNCFVDTDLGYTHVYLHMSEIKIIDSEIIYNVIVCMGYESDRGLPSRIVTETREGQILPQDVARHFSKYFRPFKKFRLQDAFEKVVSDTRCFQWTRVSRDYDEVALYMDEKHKEGEQNTEDNDEEEHEEERDELDETDKLREVHKGNNKKKNKKKMLKNKSDINLTDLEVQRGGENSSHSEKEEERSNPGRKVNKTKTRERASVKTRKKLEEKLNAKAKNVNIKKWLEGKVESTRDKNRNDIEEKTQMEKSEENLKESVNSREREQSTEKQNSKETENSVEKVDSEERENPKEKENPEEVESSQEKNRSTEKENSKEIEKSPDKDNSAEKETNDSAEKVEERSNATPQPNNVNDDGSSKKKSRRRTLLRITPKSTRKRNAKCIEDSGKLENIAKRQPVVKVIKFVKDESGQKHTEDVTSKNNNVEKILSKSSRRVETKSLETESLSLSRKSGVSNLSKKSITELATEEDNAPTVIAKNIDRNKIISSTPISRKLPTKLYTTQISEISEIVEADPPDKEMSEKDSVSSSYSDDIGDENAYEQAKELLKDIEEAIGQGKAKNTQKKVKRIKNKKKGKNT